jgi:hypothetical protein
MSLVVGETAHGADDVAVAPVFPARLHLPHLIEDVVVRRVDAQFHEQDAVPHESPSINLQDTALLGNGQPPNRRRFSRS